LKVAAFFLIYKAFVQVALTKPYQLLFLDLKRSQEEMRKSRELLESLNADLQASLRQLAEDETAARRIQFLLLPPRRLLCPGCQFESTVHTSAYLSGDFVDYFPITPQLTGFYIADVSGHGASSAFITVLLKSTMGHLLDEHQKGTSDIILHPDRVLAMLNNYMVQQHFGKYLTMFYAILDAPRASLLFSNAGQFPSPMLVDDQGARLLEQRSLPVGLFPDATYQTRKVALAPHFKLALFSDGVLDLLPQANLRQKQEFLLAQVTTDHITLDQLEVSLGLATINAPADDLTLLLLQQAA
jgi:serine phosphatase RsbU (regulator of sigma subunit)